MRGSTGPAVLGLLLLFLCQPALLAQQPKPKTETRSVLGGADLPFKIKAPYFEHKKEGEDRLVIMASGNVHAWQGELKAPELELDCQSVVIWRTRTRGKDPRTGQLKDVWSTELYAEKEVRFSRKGEVMFGDQIYFDLDRNKGLLIDARYQTQAKMGTRLVPLILRARRFRILDKNHFRGQDAYFTTCSFGDPHYRFQAAKVLIIRTPRPGAQTDDVETWSDHNVLYARQIPLFYSPKLYLPRIEDFPLKRLQTGTSSRFGRFLYTRWGQRIGHWGRWFLDVDYRSKRGPALGPGVIYKSTDPWDNEYEGRLEAYYLRDSQEGDDDELEEAATPTPERNRFRIRGRHRHFLPHQLRLDLELSHISDRNFLAEFFERELREDKPQESVIYLRKQLDNHQGTLLIKGELNEFVTSTEYLPQVTWDTIAEPVWDDHWFFRRLYWTQKSQIAYLRRHFDEDLDDPDDGRTQFRADSAHELAYPFQVGFVRFNPFLGARLSYFSDPLSGGDVRVAGSGGIRISSEFHRLYDMHFPLLDINKLMHVITPEVSYSNQYHVDPEPDELFFYDEIDTVSELQVVRLKLMNRLKTRRFDLPKHERFRYPRREGAHEEKLAFGRHLRRQGRVVEFLYFDIELPIFPDKNQNAGRQLGDLDIESVVRLRDWLSLTMDAEVRLDTGDDGADETGLRVFNIGIGINKPDETYPRWALFFGNRFARDVSNSLIFQAKLAPNPKWELSWAVQYDTREGLLESQRFTLRRYFHRLAVDLTIDQDEGERQGKGNTTVKFGVNLRAFAKDGPFSGSETSELEQQPSFKYIERLLKEQKAREQARSADEQPRAGQQ